MLKMRCDWTKAVHKYSRYIDICARQRESERLNQTVINFLSNSEQKTRTDDVYAVESHRLTFHASR